MKIGLVWEGGGVGRGRGGRWYGKEKRGGGRGRVTVLIREEGKKRTYVLTGGSAKQVNTNTFSLSLYQSPDKKVFIVSIAGIVFGHKDSGFSFRGDEEVWQELRGGGDS